MNTKAKKRLYIASLLIVMLMLGFFTFIGSGGSSKALKLAQLQGNTQYEGKKIQVSGAVKAQSLKADGSVALFELEPEPGTSDSGELKVAYGGALPATFGDGIVAICTGTYKDGTLEAKQLVTKCPSKYESAQGALTVKNLVDSAASMQDKECKLAGYIVNNSMSPLGSGKPRMIIESQGASIDVYFDGALSTEFTDGVAVVLTGSLQADGSFKATDAAIDTDLGKRA